MAPGAATGTMASSGQALVTGRIIPCPNPSRHRRRHQRQRRSRWLHWRACWASVAAGGAAAACRTITARSTAMRTRPGIAGHRPAAS